MKAKADLPFLQNYPSSFARPSLVRSSIDIGRVLAQRDGVTFKAQGTCMYPTVRPGDVLNIKPRFAADIAIGDIAVCRTSDYLFSHRVIDKGMLDGKSYIITRPDRSHKGSDAPTFDENLLGIVVEIKRNGKSVPLIPIRYSWFNRYYYKKRLSLIEKKDVLKLRLAERLSNTNVSIFYQSVVRAYFKLARPHVTSFIHVPLNATLGDAVFHRFEPDTFNPEESINGRKIKRWTIATYINNDNQPAAWSVFVRDNNDKWTLVDSHVRLRYHGAGIDTMLNSKIEIILNRNN